MKSEHDTRDTPDSLPGPLVLPPLSQSTGTTSPENQTAAAAEESHGSQTAIFQRIRLEVDQVPTVRVQPHVVRDRARVNPAIRRAFSDAIKRHAWPLFIWGGVGSGKTCSVLCMFDHVKNGGWRRFHTLTEWTEMAHQAEAGRMQQAGGIITPGHWWKQNDDAVLIAVDELGAVEANANSDHAGREYTTLKRLMDIRTSKPAIYISNHSPDDLLRIYDTRIVSRLMAGVVVHDQGADQRGLVPAEARQ